MPLTAKGEEIKSALEKEYGGKAGERILYAGKNKGTFTGIDAAERTPSSNITKMRSESELKNISKFNERVKELQKESLEKNEPMKKLTKRSYDSATMTRIADAINNLQQRFDALIDSDAGAKPRMFGSYTTAQLKNSVSEGVNEWRPRETIEKMIKEIQARESGVSKLTVTPQIQGGKPNPKVGRM